MPHNRPLRLSALAAALIAGPVALCVTPASAVTGTPAADATFSSTAQIIVGNHDRGCSGVLVDTEWLLTAASCFADNPATSLAVPAGTPKLKTTATIGRNDTSATGGAVRQVVELVPRSDRDVVLARLNRPVTNVAPTALSTAAPTAGEELKFAGYGRTKTEWAPLKLHTGVLSVDASASAATTATVTGKDGAAACMGDTGGPLVRVVNGTHQLVALSSRSHQGGCFGIDTAETRTGGIAARVDDLASWVSSKVGATRITDFNGDGVEDVAISDPKATVGGDADAGVVRAVYGGGKGTAEISQDLDWVTGGAEAGDWFGESLDTVDYNEDGYTDLVVGTPSEDIEGATAAGMVDVLYGGSGGLGTGTQKATHFEQGAGSGAIAAAAGESGDRMGDALAAGTTAAGEPYIVIGVPGEALGSITKAGMAFYLRGATNVSIHQDKTDVPGDAEANDAFGGSIAADSNKLAIGVPTEAIGSDAGSGGVTIFDHKLNAANIPTPLSGIDQDLDAISGDAEPGDQFSASLSMTEYRPSGAAAATESILAIGSPGEDLTIDSVGKADAGRVVTLRITAAGTWTQLEDIKQGAGDDDVSGTSEAGDRMGSAVTAVNTAPRAVSTTATMKLAVGTPNEFVGTATKAGAVHTFSLLGSAGANDRWIEAGDGDGIPGTPGANQQLGSSIHFTGTKLYVGMPYGPSTYGALYALPMSNVTAGGTVTAVTTYKPGTGGLPAAGARFGYAAR
ncbi:trypsin-like serine protease [Streptomyces sp. ISL-100]|uniref:trypsin-like serine protease n=1 Tax=Streptomyces sp. ISL-100 TaxID=2819173 RepID=UPI001BECD99B|nr:trypsin-like serine protease [Streptomyces sp. ISL-100]MBT2396453.1 trypsin-like serine protease [Streptomyces sp. ISL-100]